MPGRARLPEGLALGLEVTLPPAAPAAPPAPLGALLPPLAPGGGVADRGGSEALCDRQPLACQLRGSREETEAAAPAADNAAGRAQGQLSCHPGQLVHPAAVLLVEHSSRGSATELTPVAAAAARQAGLAAAAATAEARQAKLAEAATAAG